MQNTEGTLIVLFKSQFALEDALHAERPIIVQERQLRALPFGVWLRHSQLFFDAHRGVDVDEYNHHHDVRRQLRRR